MRFAKLSCLQVGTIIEFEMILQQTPKIEIILKVGELNKLGISNCCEKVNPRITDSRALTKG